ncbi:MAG: homocysteine S-methyltransferase family protein [Oscillospiraceae bacterium]|nr:homocysteine S-methyltransferase family protein [Oscillospiraceae bacterium]
MLSKNELSARLGKIILLDGATGSNLQKAGMPRGCCTEEWILANPDKLISLQREYAAAGSQILYAPTFQAQPIALERVGLARQAETINAHLVALTKSVSPNVLVAGNLTTLAAYCDSFDPENFDLLVENYRVQIGGLLEGGADLLAAETLMYPQEAEAILTAAELEGAGSVLYTFTMQPDGSLFSGRDAAPVLKELEEAGAWAVGFNCVAADSMTAGLVSRLRRQIKCPLVCKPNAGTPIIGMDGIPVYPMHPDEFASIILDCAEAGAAILGGCCGTTPDHIAAVKAKFPF